MDSFFYTETGMLFGGIVLAVIVLIIMLVIMFCNRKVDVYRVYYSQGFVYKAVKNYAYNEVARQYKQLGKPIKTQKGAYRVDFKQKEQEFFNATVQQCFVNDGHFNSEFCNYVSSAKKSVRVPEFEFLIKSYMEYKKNVAMQRTNNFLNQVQAITPEEFFSIKQNMKGDVVGVYVIHNQMKNMYYVGQAKRVFFRVNQHFTGHGNGDVYADYKYGNRFVIQIIKLTDSGYSDLDALEKAMIQKYDAYNSGYNRTAGNK